MVSRPPAARAPSASRPNDMRAARSRLAALLLLAVCGAVTHCSARQQPGELASSSCAPDVDILRRKLTPVCLRSATWQSGALCFHHGQIAPSEDHQLPVQAMGKASCSNRAMLGTCLFCLLRTMRAC